MLPAERRLRRGKDIASTVKSGRRCGSRLVVVHYTPIFGSSELDENVCCFAFAVGKGVGNSVMRHRVTRQLRHAVLDTASDWDQVASEAVVRALPAAAGASSVEFAHSLAQCMAKARKAAAKDPPPGAVPDEVRQ